MSNLFCAQRVRSYPLDTTQQYQAESRGEPHEIHDAPCYGSVSRSVGRAITVRDRVGVPSIAMPKTTTKVDAAGRESGIAILSEWGYHEQL